MFERFTQPARQVVVLAQDEARLLRHNYIGTEHLLLGLMRQEEGLAAIVLESLRLDLDAVRGRVVEIVGPSDEEATTGQIPFTPRAKKVLELSLREAKGLGSNHIGTEHILLGLVRENEGVAARILDGFGADAARIRGALLERLPGASRARSELASATLAARGWEYRVVLAVDLGVGRLDEIGSDDWELVTVLTEAEGYRLIFKRRKR